MKGRILQNDEAVSPILGAILILAISTVVITNVQINFVPIWNAQEELNHLEIMNDEFKELKSNIESSAVSGTSLSSSLSMGLRYSPKIIVYNPKESAYATLSIQNDTWAEVRYNEMLPEGTDDTTSIKNISTSTITYSLKGNQNLSSFIFEHGIIRRGGSNYTKDSQTLVANGTIYLLSLKPTEPETVTGVERRIINIYPTSKPMNSVIGKNVWLILHTKYVDWWTDPNNPGSIQNQGGTIKRIDNANGIIIAYFDRMVIRMGETHITTLSKKPPSHAPPMRLIKVTPQNINLPVEGISSLGVEVQDYYDNPVPNVLVSFNINTTRMPGNAYSTATLLQSSAVSGADGKANIMLMTGGPGIYYIDASIVNSSYKTTFAYPATSQGGFISLSYVDASPNYIVKATLKNGFGETLPTESISFVPGEGTVSPLTNQTDGNGSTSTILNTATATGIKITDIQATNITINSAIVTWTTENTITVAANRTPGGYIFNTLDIPTNVSSNGCVWYGTSPGNYPYLNCDILASSHSVNLTGLQPSTAYYFIVNSSRPGNENINSSEYMFVTNQVSDMIPPASINNITVTTAPLYINWTWKDPSDADFDHVEVYVDGIFQTDVARGVQSYNATYFMPNSTHTISTRTVDTSSNVNATWMNNTASTLSVYTYVFNFLNITGTVTNFSNAQSDSDGGAFTTFAEQQMGATNQNDRPKSPSKNVIIGTQSDGMYNSSYVDNSGDGLVDITVPAIYATSTKSYLMNTANTGVGGTIYWNINPVAGGAADTTTTIPINKNTPTGYYIFKPGVSNNVAGTPGIVPAGYGWASSTPINGTTSVGSWSFQVKSIGYGGSGNGIIVVYVYKYNSTSTTNTFLFSAVGTYNHVVNATTIENITSTIQPSYTFNSTEYLKIEYWLNLINAPTPASLRNMAFEANSPMPFVINAINSYSLDTTYIFNETNSSAKWQSISINDSSYGDPLTSIKIFNATSGLWESILTNAFTGGTSPTTHVNTVVGANANASSYDSGLGQIKIRYNWTAAALNNSLGVDLINLTVGYTTPVTYHLNITTNITSIPESNIYIFQLKYNVSGENFTLQLWNGSVWNDKSTLNDTSLSYRNITLQPEELIPEGNLTGNVGNINNYYVLTRYLDLNAGGTQQGMLYLDYQRVYGG